MLRRLHLLLLLICIVSYANAKRHTDYNSATIVFNYNSTNPAADTSFHLIYEDAKTKLFYTEDICDNVVVLRLKVINLTDVSTVISYKIWTDVSPKSISLFARQELEGTCSLEYKSVLLETIPAGLSINDIKVSVTY